MIGSLSIFENNTLTPSKNLHHWIQYQGRQRGSLLWSIISFIYGSVFWDFIFHFISAFVFVEGYFGVICHVFFFKYNHFLSIIFQYNRNFLVLQFFKTFSCTVSFLSDIIFIYHIFFKSLFPILVLIFFIFLIFIYFEINSPNIPYLIYYFYYTTTQNIFYFNEFYSSMISIMKRNGISVTKHMTNLWSIKNWTWDIESTTFFLLTEIFFMQHGEENLKHQQRDFFLCNTERST